jgi:hypothetical protein
MVTISKTIVKTLKKKNEFCCNLSFILSSFPIKMQYMYLFTIFFLISPPLIIKCKILMRENITKGAKGAKVKSFSKDCMWHMAFLLFIIYYFSYLVYYYVLDFCLKITYWSYIIIHIYNTFMCFTLNNHC